MYIILAFFIGITIVINMMLNGKLSQSVGMINGIWVNYFMATISSIIICLFTVDFSQSFMVIKSVPIIYFLGGFIGVLTTYLFNLIVPKIPAVYVVLLRFIGQMLTSALIDYVYLDTFSKGKIIGGVLFFIGLIVNAKADNKIFQKI